MRREKGFTSIDLLATASIIAFLLAISVPTLETDREHARRVVCSSQIKQVLFAMKGYAAADRQGRFPASSNIEGYFYLDWIEGEYPPNKTLVKPGGLFGEWANAAADDTRVFVCPNLKAQFDVREGYVVKDAFTKLPAEGKPYRPFSEWHFYYIGYANLGGHDIPQGSRLPEGVKRIVSPQRITDSGQLALFVDTTINFPGLAQVPHGRSGLVTASGQEINMEEMATDAGTNVGKVDGSVQFKKLLAETQAYISRRQASSGEEAARYLTFY